MPSKVNEGNRYRRAVELLCVALTALFYSGCADRQPSTASEFPPPFLEAETITVSHGGGGQCPFRFNDNRCTVISINRGTPNANKLRAETVEDLAARHVLDQVVFEWFGSTEGTDAIRLDIGDHVPVTVAQSLLTASSRLGGVPVSVQVTSSDGQLGDRQRIYVNSLLAAKKKPISELKMRALLVPGISDKEFYGGCREQ